MLAAKGLERELQRRMLRGRVMVRARARARARAGRRLWGMRLEMLGASLGEIACRVMRAGCLSFFLAGVRRLASRGLGGSCWKTKMGMWLLSF